jgi:hypothetical protein
MSSEMEEKAGVMAQVVEHLPSKHEALSSNSNITKDGGGKC